MSFKNRKRDDRGHVIGNDEVDGQKCQHSSGSSTGFGAGGAKEREKNKYNYREEKSREKEGIAAYQQLLAEKNPNFNKEKYGQFFDENGQLIKGKEQEYFDAKNKNEPFDDDYEEEFNEDRSEKIANDIGEYFNDNQLNQLKKYCDKYEVDFDVAKTELAKRFDSMQKDSGYAAPDAADAALDTLTEDIVMGYNPSNEYDEEMKAAQNENADMSADEGMSQEELNKIKSKEDSEMQKMKEDGQKAANDFNARMEKYNRMVGLESQMHSKIDNARKNGQTPQQVLDSVAYDMDIQPGTEEYDRLKTLVMYDTRMNKDTGQYEYNKYNSGSNKQVSGDERKKLQDLSDAFNKAGLENKLQDTWEDYGARMGMTNLIHNNTQVLNPRDWIDYMNGNASVEDIIQRIKDSPYKSAFRWKEPTEENEMKSRYQKIREVLGDNADETIEWLFNHLSKLNDYKKGK